MEPAKDYDVRSGEAERDHWTVTRFERQLKDLTEANRIYLAQISEKTDHFRAGYRQEPYANHVVVRPIRAVRGRLPSSAIKLVNNFPHSCVIDGNGDAASGKVGEYVFVFEGVWTHGEKGVDSIMAKDAHSEPLVKALENYIVETDGGPYRIDKQGNTTVRKADGSFQPQ